MESITGFDVSLWRTYLEAGIVLVDLARCCIELMCISRPDKL